MQFEYLLILLVLYISALLLKFKFKINVFKNKRQIFIYFLIVIIIGTIWDNYAIWRGHWAYPTGGTLGIRIGLIPIEDYLFGIICAYFLLVLYKVIKKTS